MPETSAALPDDSALAAAGASKPPVAVIDVDGVVADVRHRLKHLESTPKDWGGFFAAAAQDPPLAVGVERVRGLAAGLQIIWLTGRPESLRETTVEWFRAHGLPAGRLIMRRGGDRRPAKLVKRAELRRLGSRYTVRLVLDDDPAVVAALAADGWPVERADWVGYAPELGKAQESAGRT